MAMIQLPVKTALLTLVMALTACATQPDPRFPVAPLVKLPAIVVPPGAPADNVVMIEDKMWQLVALTKSVSANSIQDGAFLAFESLNHRLKGSTGCNRLMGAYQLNGQQLKLTDIASTKMFCPSGGIVQEAIFIEALSDTTAWKIEANHLYLLDKNSEKVAVFELR